MSSVAFPRKGIPAEAEYSILFIAFCYSHCLACTTVATYVLALSSQHKIRNMEGQTHFLV